MTIRAYQLLPAGLLLLRSALSLSPHQAVARSRSVVGSSYYILLQQGCRHPPQENAMGSGYGEELAKRCVIEEQDTHRHIHIDTRGDCRSNIPLSSLLLYFVDCLVEF